MTMSIAEQASPKERLFTVSAAFLQDHSPIAVDEVRCHGECLNQFIHLARMYLHHLSHRCEREFFFPFDELLKAS